MFRTESPPGSETLQQNIKENDQKALTYIGLKRQLPLSTKQLHLKFPKRSCSSSVQSSKGLTAHNSIIAR